MQNSDEKISFKNLEYQKNGTLFTADIGRVNVIMGANGSGKSQLLRAMSDHIHSYNSEKKAIFVEGGRSLMFDINVGMQPNSLPIYNDPIGYEKNYVRKRSNRLSDRMNNALILLKALEQTKKSTHSDEVQAWEDSGRTGDIPKRPRLPFEQFKNIFESIFPDIKIIITPSNQLYAEKNGEEYPANSMSDGEKQIFMLTADLLSFKNENQIFFIDEPELNLHTSLAEQFWNLLESEIPNGIFVYATHSLSFATRENVELIYLLGYGIISESEIKLQHDHIKPFLGSFPKLMKSSKCLLVEGEEESIDGALYRWMLNDQNISVIPVGGSSEVYLAASRQGLWKKLSDKTVIAGIIDRDFKSIDCSYQNCITLPYHEAESILSHPKIVLGLQQSLGNTEKNSTYDELVDILCAEAAERKIYVSLQRTFNQLSVNIRVSAEKSTISRIENAESAIRILLRAANSEIQKAHAICDENSIVSIFNKELERCQNAIDKKMLTIYF